VIFQIARSPADRTRRRTPPADEPTIRRRPRVGAAAERDADEIGGVVSSCAEAPLPAAVTSTRIRRGPSNVIRRYWDLDWMTKSAVWRGAGSWASDPTTQRVMNDGFVMVDVHGNTLYDPRAGAPKRAGGGGGFALGSGTNTQATFNMFQNPVTVGGPLGGNGPQETVDYGLFSVHHQGGDWQPQQFGTPKPAGNVVPAPQHLPSLPPTLTSSFVSSDITSQFSGIREDKSRFPTQKAAMSNMTAAQANQRAGQDIPDGQWDWMHRHRFQHGGIDHQQPNVPENFVAGTHGANIRHLTLENAVSYSSESYGPIPVSTGLRDARSEAHHVYGAMDYTTHSAMDVDVSMTAPIDLRNPMMPRRADQGYANKAQDTFQQWAVTHEMIKSGVMTPADLGPDGARLYLEFVARYVHK
jgi:hypothetical protein